MPPINSFPVSGSREPYLGSNFKELVHLVHYNELITDKKMELLSDQIKTPIKQNNLIDIVPQKTENPITSSILSNEDIEYFQHNHTTTEDIYPKQSLEISPGLSSTIKRDENLNWGARKYDIIPGIPFFKEIV